MIAKGTVRTMGQIGVVMSYLALMAGLLRFWQAGWLASLVELYIMAQMCLNIALHVGLRFAAW